MKYLLAALLVLTPSSVYAALSGYYDSAEQISMILGNGEVADAVRQAPIGQITNSGTRDDGAAEWVVRTQDCDLTVYLVPEPPAGVGKTSYRVELPTACQ